MTHNTNLECCTDYGKPRQMRVNRITVTLANFILAVFPFAMIPLTGIAVYDYVAAEIFNTDYTIGWFDFMGTGTAAGTLLLTTTLVLTWGGIQK